MKFIIVFVVLLNFINTEGFPIAMRAVIINSRQAGRRVKRIDNKVKFYQEKAKKCDYANKLFGSSPNVCPVQAEDSYKHIYESFYQKDLWNFHQAECVSNEIHTIFQLVVVGTAVTFYMVFCGFM
jgi:hypothetical protein